MGANGDRRFRKRRLAPSLVPAATMLALGAYRIAEPSLGRDEAATLIVVRRSAIHIAQLARHVDAVIAPYYLFLHAWTEVFGTSELALRAPSLIAVAVGVGLVGELGRRLFTPSIGLVAGLLVAIVPAMSRYAQEARAYGIAFALAMLATLLLYLAMERTTWRRWSLYGVVLSLLGLFQLLGLTLLAGHAVAVHLRGRHHGRVWRPFLLAALGALVVVTPLALRGLEQHDAQLYWVQPVDLRTVALAPTDIFRSEVAWLVIGLAICARWPDRARLAGLAAMAILPPALLLAESAVATPYWVSRYVLFTIAPLALIAAVGLERFGWRAIAVLVGVAVISWPVQRAFRERTSRQGPDARVVAQIIRANEAPGDGIVYVGENTWALRSTIDYYLAGSPAPRDLLLFRSGAALGTLADRQCPDVVACIGQTSRIWMVRQGGRGELVAKGGKVGALLRSDYRPAASWRIPLGTVALYVRTG